MSVSWHFENGATSKIDDVLIELDGLLHILPLAIQRVLPDSELDIKAQIPTPLLTRISVSYMVHDSCM